MSSVGECRSPELCDRTKVCQHPGPCYGRRASTVEVVARMLTAPCDWDERLGGAHEEVRAEARELARSIIAVVRGGESA